MQPLDTTETQVTRNQLQCLQQIAKQTGDRELLRSSTAALQALNRKLISSILAQSNLYSA